ncbi:MAG: hypothetical protein ACM3X6_13345 [Patescibacteria group bacterium]
MTMHRLSIVLVGAIAFALALTGCGPSSETETIELYSEGDYDGSVTKTNTNFGTYYSMHISAGEGVWVGMNYYTVMMSSRVPPQYNHIRESSRLLLSFDLSSLAGETVQSATLHVYLVSTVGTPFSDLGGVSIDHVSYGTDLSALTESDLYDGYVVEPAVPGEITDPTVPAWKTIDVTAAVQADLAAGRGRAQFRLKHPEDMSATSNDKSYWCTGDNTSFPAKLVVVY